MYVRQLNKKKKKKKTPHTPALYSTSSVDLCNSKSAAAFHLIHIAIVLLVIFLFSAFLIITMYVCRYI